MARFLGTASGRTTTTYVDTSVNTACSQLCTYTNTCIGCACSQLCGFVNTTCSTLNGNINTACSNLCTFVNNCKVACNGSGAGLTNVVNSIAVSGTGISVNQSTGAVTITSTGAADPKVLYKCNGCWNGSAIIPSGDRGLYSAYEIFGHTYCWQYFCSQASFSFIPAPGCSAMFESYCCTQCTNGFIAVNAPGCGCFTTYSCAGAIPWPFGCGSGYTRFSACTSLGFNFHVMLTPGNACCTADKSFHYCFATSNNGPYGLCGGIRNSGCAINCCGGFPGCLHGVCFSTPSATNGFNSPANVVIIGHGRLA
jgi:hypothetical protein